MSSVTTEGLKSELEMFCIACEDDSALDKMVEQCICNRMQADEWVLEWVAYSTTKNGLVLSVDSLEQFEHEVLSKRNRSKQSFKREERNRPRDIQTIQDIIKSEEDDEDNLLDCYSTPAKGSQKRVLTTPENPHSKRTLLASPGFLLSPASFSPSPTPSQKYSQRGGKGEVVVSFGAVQGTRWAGRKAPGAVVKLELVEGPEDSLHCSYKYMFQRLRDIRNVLTEKIEELGEDLQSHFNIDEFSPVSLPAQDCVSVLGQVCCDSNGKLNAQSVLLEAGPEQGGQQVRVDLSELQEYSLFPGQHFLDLHGHPGLLIWIDPNAFIHRDNVYGVLNVTQYAVTVHLQVWVFKNVPISPPETVLQLLKDSVRPSFNCLCGDEFS